MTRFTLVLVLGLQACGPRSPGPEQPDAASASGRDGERGVAANPNRSESPGPEPGQASATACPARFDFAMHGGTCTVGGHCVYPEAECWCQTQQECTGVDLGPEAHAWLEWSCRVSDPKVRRADGCPARVPEQGQRCRKDGQLCGYSPYCGGIQSTARCSNDAWQLTQIEVSAPPSSEG